MRKLDVNSGFKVNILILRDTTFRTSFGGFLSIIIFILSILYIIAFGKDIFKTIIKNSPIVYLSDYINNHTLRLEKTIFDAAIASMNLGGATITNIEKMINIDVIIAKTNSKNNPITDYTFVNSKKCKDYLTKEKFNEIKMRFITSEESYFSFSNNTSNLENTFGNPKFNIWMFQISFCKNTTENNNNCLPIEKIHKNLKEVYFQLIFSNNYIDSSDFGEPVKFNYNDMLIRSTSYSNRLDTFYLKKFDYFSDNGFILEDKIKYSGFYVNKHEFDSIPIISSNVIFKVIFTLDEFQQKIERSYIIIQKIAADIGGIIKFFL